MIKKIFLTSVTGLLILTACESNDLSYGEKYDVDEPLQEAPMEGGSLVEEPITIENYEITGMVEITLSDSPEFGCDYGEKDSEVKCTSGIGVFYLSNVAAIVFLQDYSCPVTQYYVHDSLGIKNIEYRPDSECDEWLTIGDVYTATGELTIKKGVWKTVSTNGKQVEEQWLKVDSIVLEPSAKVGAF